MRQACQMQAYLSQRQSWQSNLPRVQQRQIYCEALGLHDTGNAHRGAVAKAEWWLRNINVFLKGMEGMEGAQECSVGGRYLTRRSASLPRYVLPCSCRRPHLEYCAIHRSDNCEGEADGDTSDLHSRQQASHPGEALILEPRQTKTSKFKCPESGIHTSI